MNYFKNPETNQVYAYDDEQVKSGIVRKELVKMTKKEIDAHINPVVTAEQLIEQAEAQKQYLIAEVQTETQMLQTKLALKRINPAELELLNAWLDYLDELEAVDESTAPDIDWPVKPVA